MQASSARSRPLNAPYLLSTSDLNVMRRFLVEIKLTKSTAFTTVCEVMSTTSYAAWCALTAHLQLTGIDYHTAQVTDLDVLTAFTPTLAIPSKKDSTWPAPPTPPSRSAVR